MEASDLTIAKQATRRRLAQAKALIPVPKVLVPVVAGFVALVGKVIATGELNREELAALWVLFGYAAIGWFTPEGKN